MGEKWKKVWEEESEDRISRKEKRNWKRIQRNAEKEEKRSIQSYCGRGKKKEVKEQERD